MIQSRTKIRVRYGETDQMGFVYYGVYAQYYEVGRVETMRLLGFSYKDVESRGIWMPVISFSINYKKPAMYDDEIEIITTLKEKPSGLRLIFHYECFNSSKELLNTGSVTLVCMDKNTSRAIQIPDWFLKGFEPFFKQNA